MDRLPNLTSGINDSTPIPSQNCAEASYLQLDKLLVTTPSWESVNQDLRWFFLLHTYTFACLFFVLSFYTFFSFLNLRSLISTPPFMSSINIFLCLLGASRSGCLFIDPYNFKEIMPKVIGSILWDIGFPFITSAFCLIQLTFLQLTQVKFGLEKFQKETYLSLMIIFHFSCIIISDISLALHISYMAKYVVQTVFLIWSIILYVTFLYAGYKVKILLKTLPSNVLARDHFATNQKGIMQLAMLAPYNNLATSVAAALVPTLLNPKLKALEDSEPNKSSEFNPSSKSTPRSASVKLPRVQQDQEKNDKNDSNSNSKPLVEQPPNSSLSQSISTVPEVYVRPPTPTPSIANLPIITVSSPSRRSSLASRRSSDVSSNSRRASECGVRFVNGDDASPNQESSPSKRSPQQSPSLDRPHSPEGILRRNSDCATGTPSASNKDLRRCSDFTHEKNRSQFATKLRRNSDFGNRVPRRVQPEQSEQSKLFKILDVSPTGSRRNSDLGGLVPTKVVESRRNSDVSCRSSSERRSSDVAQIKPLVINRRSSDVSIRTLDNSPTHHSPGGLIYDKTESQQQQEFKSESDSDQPDNYYSNEKAALMNGNDKSKAEESAKNIKKNLSWKSDNFKDEQENITPETSLLSEAPQNSGVVGTDFTLHSILNHIAYVNRAKSDTPLHIPEMTTAAAKRAQIKRVLNVTYATAILGIILCVEDAARIFGPYGLFADVVRSGTKPLSTQFPKPWPWIIYQTVCRFLELVMACAMASITKQPSASPRHQYLSNYPSYNLRIKQRDNLYI